MSDQLAIDPARSALLVMDLQNDLVSRGGVMTTSDEEALTRIDAAIAAAKAAARAARAAGMADVHARRYLGDRRDPRLGAILRPGG